MTPRPLAVAVLAAGLVACHDVTRFSTHGDHFEGAVVGASFVRTGVAEGTRMCVLLDGNHLQDAPGSITTSDGRFQATPLRPIPQLWHDPLSLLAFGEGRTQNLLYMAAPVSPAEPDATVVVSLMQSGSLEVRLLRGAPGATAPSSDAVAAPLFAIFPLTRAEGPCSF